MVKVYLSGPGGSGKTTLARGLLAQRPFSGYKQIKEVARIFMQNEGIDGTALRKFNWFQFHEFQKNILLAQCEAEINIGGCVDFISDRSIFDCLAYAFWKYPQHNGDVMSDLQGFCQMFNIDEDIREAVARHQTALLVIVHPWSGEASADDGTRYPMEHEDGKIFIDILKRLLHHFKISYLDLTESDLRRRTDILKEAINGEMKRENYTLQFYKELSDKGKRGGKNYTPISKKVEYGNVIISFYLPYDTQNDIRSISISEDRIRLSTAKLGDQRGRIFTEVDLGDIVTVSFDKKLPSDQVRQILNKDVFVGGEIYTFLGCSSGGLKERKAFLIKGDVQRAADVLAMFGKFDEINSVSKKMARIGLLFSSVYITGVAITPDQIIEGCDIERNKYVFTDGCGNIGTSLSKQIYDCLPDPKKILEPVGYQPSVYQFRLHGLKGVVVVDPSMAPDKLMVRPSMRKFKSDTLPYFSVCDISRPYTYGHLNRQLIYLLSCRQIPDSIFLELQQELFDSLSNMYTDRETAITMLHCYAKYEEANALVQARAPFVLDPRIRSKLRAIEQKYLTKDQKVGEERTKEKLRIIVKKSRLLYGVADQSNLLEYGQCYVRITVNDVPKVITGNILTGRMPCYLKGDLRILEAVDVPQLKHLVDCIVFPTRGERPHADEQGGGDLDGDKFFVTWDHRLIPQQKVLSLCYPGASTTKEKQPDLAAMIRYFSLQNNSTKMNGLVNNLFESWANLKGADCDECRWIGQFFGRVVDSVKTGEKMVVPTAFLNPPSSLDENQREFVWQTLEKNALRYKSESKATIARNGVQSEEYLKDISFDYVDCLVEDQFTSLSEYEKFKFVWLYCSSRCEQNFVETLTFMNEHFMKKINFALFSTTEKLEAMDLGVSPMLVFNGLTKSDVLDEDDLLHYNVLNTRSGWGIVFRGGTSTLDFDDFANKIICRECLLIIWQMPDNVCIGIRITQTLSKGGQQCLPVGSITSFLISRSFAYYKQYEPKEDLYYDLYDGRFQIYRQQNVANSFLSLSSQGFYAAADKPKTIFDLSKNQLRDVLSVDLTSYDKGILRGKRPHPLVRKTPVQCIEVFASEKGVPMYPDVLIGNMTEVEFEDDDFECLDGDVDDRDVCKLLCDELVDVNQRSLSLDGVKDTLNRLVAMAMPWNCAMTSEVEDEIMKLLENVKIASLSWRDGVHVLASLSKLGCTNLGLNLVSKITLELTKEEFFEILTDWTLIWFMNAVDFMTLLQRLRTLLLSRLDLTPRERYLVNVFWSSVVEFVDDMETCKALWKQRCVTQMKLMNDHSTIGYGEDQREEEMAKDTVFHLFRSAPFKKEPFLPNLGDHVLLVRAKDYGRSGSIVHSVSGIASVLSLTRFPISMQLKLRGDEIPTVLKDTDYSNWIVVLLSDVNIALYSRIVAACSVLVSETSPVIDYVCSVLNGGVTRTACSSKEIELSDGKELNPAQKIAISACFARTITCIQGPPGCGKTKCAGSVLKHAVQLYSGKEILAVAETNTAVDNMTRKLQKAGVKVVRIAGDPRKISPDLLDTTVEGKLRLLAEREGKKVDFRLATGETMLKKNLKKRILNDADVVLTTCAGAGEVFLLERKFKFVLVDEATQTKQATLLCALAHKAEKLVLIGDPMQLGPLVKLQKGLDWLPDDIVDETSRELSQSLFHRLHAAEPDATYLLDTQYRMHPDIAAFSSGNFYGGRVKSGTTPESRRPAWPFGARPVGFVHVDGEERRQGTSYVNESEQAIIVGAISKMLASPDITKKDVTVLALYNGQVRSLRKCLDEVAVSSIDGFQGKENDYILVSTVRSNFNLGHTDDAKRLNVLLTRAKRGLIIFGHRPTLMTSELWKKWVESVPSLQL